MDKTRDNLVWIIFAAVGGICVAIGAIICINVFDYSNKIITTGTISKIERYRDSDGDTDHTVYVTYEIDNEEYTNKLNGYMSSYKEGKEIEIYYDKKNPNKIGTKSLDLVMLVFPGIGLIFLIMGLIGIIYNKVKESKEKQLLLNGDIITAKFVRVDENTGYTVNGKHPFNIICEGLNPTTGETMTFKSKNLWTNPNIMIIQQDIKEFRVFIDMNKPKNYIIDLEGLNLEYKKRKQ